MAAPIFEIKDLCVEIEERTVVKGLSMKILPGEVHALMGRNGSGKTSLANAIMGHPKFKVTSGKIYLEGKDITSLAPDQRAKRRLFLAFQNPVSIPGVTVANFLRSSLRAVRGDEIPSKEFRKLIKQELKALQIPETFMTRSINEGFSGGEKKKLEMLQLRLLQPKLAVLDETDSGLDIDALRTIAEKIEDFRAPNRGILLITHYQRILNYVKPDYVHVLIDGKIVRSGDASLAQELEKEGYSSIIKMKERASGG